MPAFRFDSGPGPASASARDAGALKHLEEIKAYCGVISAEQEAILADAKFIGGEDEEVEEVDVFSTPPLTQRDLQGQGQSHGGPAGEEVEEEGITMFTMPFTQTQPSACASSSSTESRQRKRRKPPKTPRITDCTRKVRAGTKIWPPTPTTPTTPAPTPTTTAPAPAPAPAPTPTTPAPAPAPRPGPEQDPLFRSVMMIPTKRPPPTTGQSNLLELSRKLGIV